MGVPTFFRWLTLRYPKCVVDANDASLAHDLPQFDCLYLDLNGIIHPCCHPEGKQPESEFDIFQNIFVYIEDLARIVKPKKLIYMAIDGVAPRAKMNQQRARRFRKVLDEKEKVPGNNIREETKESSDFRFDTNEITPGTPFMERLAEALHGFVMRKLEGDWKHLNIIFSDSNNPGEGEHKILEFIRTQRAQPEHNPNIKHVIYGADADLIMLSLVTHEAHFYIIRENVMDYKKVFCKICGQPGHFEYDCKGSARMRVDENDTLQPVIASAKFQFIRLPVLRQYLYYEFQELTRYPIYDFERVLDDFIFLCFFVGNDFLPHLPSLQIRDGAIDGLIYLYSKIFYKLGGYLTENGKVVLYRVDILFAEIAKVEDEYFKQKSEREEYMKKRNQNNAPRKRKVEDTSEEDKNSLAAQKLLEEIVEEEDNVVDNIRLGEDGWRQRYYQEKFEVSQEEFENFRQKIHKSYMEGISWVFQYYYDGCPSWGWYYPYHYAPFASDLYNSHLIKIEFIQGAPFQPYAQLLAVLPPASAKALPEPIRPLLLDPSSEIIDFYPDSFKFDINGKRFAWQGVVLLPFIDEKRLLAALEPKLSLLNAQDTLRNTWGDTLLYTPRSLPEWTLIYTGTAPKFSDRYQVPVGSNVLLYVVTNPPKRPHSSQKLPGVVEAKPEVDEHVFRCGDRRQFGGFTLINLVSRNLTQDVYSQSWKQQRADPFANVNVAYNNNRGVSMPVQEKKVQEQIPVPSKGGDLVANLKRLVELLAQKKTGE